MEALFFIRGGGLACSRRARHGALAGRRIAGASFVTLTCRRRGKLISGAGTILPGCWRRSCWCRRRRRSLVELISFADAPPAGLARLLQGWSERSPDAPPSKPTMSSWKYPSILEKIL